MINISANVWDIGASTQVPAGQAYSFNGDGFELLVLPMLDKLRASTLVSQEQGEQQVVLLPAARS